MICGLGTCTECRYDYVSGSTSVPGGGGGGGASGAGGGSIIIRGSSTSNDINGVISANGGEGGSGGAAGIGTLRDSAFFGGKGGNGFKGRDGFIRVFGIDT